MLALIIWALLIIYIGACIDPEVPLILIALLAVGYIVLYIAHRLSVRKILKESGTAGTMIIKGRTMK